MTTFAVLGTGGVGGYFGAGTTSLQRDLNSGKPSELEAWTGAVVRLGRETGVPTPLTDVLDELASARGR